MKESLETTLKDVELTKEVYRLYTLEHQLLPSFCFLGFKGDVCQCRRGAWVIWKFRNVNWPSSAPDNKKGWQGV